LGRGLGWGFTLVELIVVVTILAILWTIAFISLQWYTQEARDSKRISDVRSLISKITIENTKWTSYSEIIGSEEAKNTLTINWTSQTGTQNIKNPINRELLKENKENFVDPLNNHPYPFAYANWEAGLQNYNFMQLAYVSEKTGWTKLVWNYYKMNEEEDSPSLFVWNEKIEENWCPIYDIWLPYTPPLSACSLWQYADISCWNEYKSKVAVYPEDTYSSATTFWSIALDNWRNWWVLGPNWKIYWIPWESQKVLEIDPETHNLAQIWWPLPTTVGKRLWWVLALNWSIYWIPCNSANVLKINPEIWTTEEIIWNLWTWVRKRLWWALAPNWKIYWIPRDSSKVLKIDPETNIITEFWGLWTWTHKWAWWVLAPNWKIYWIPYHSDKILEIDPETDTVRLFWDSSIIWTWTYKWNWWILGLNWKIYWIPMNALTILEIDPETDSVETFWILWWDSTTKWEWWILAPNWKIYWAPRNNAWVLEIDTENGTARMLSPVFLNDFWHWLILASNGKAYWIPIGEAPLSVLEISFSTDREFSVDSLLWAYVNNY
jgi:prepilin-type N-terminal cleavage/methylation domain-containing protein